MKEGQAAAKSNLKDLLTVTPSKGEREEEEEEEEENDDDNDDNDEVVDMFTNTKLTENVASKGTKGSNVPVPKLLTDLLSTLKPSSEVNMPLFSKFQPDTFPYPVFITCLSFQQAHLKLVQINPDNPLYFQHIFAFIGEPGHGEGLHLFTNLIQFLATQPLVMSHLNSFSMLELKDWNIDNTLLGKDD